MNNFLSYGFYRNFRFFLLDHFHSFKNDKSYVFKSILFCLQCILSGTIEDNSINIMFCMFCVSINLWIRSRDSVGHKFSAVNKRECVCVCADDKLRNILKVKIFNKKCVK